MSCNVAFIGLGVMGYPMAGYISKGGHNVTVFNRTKSKAEKWIKEYKGYLIDIGRATTDADAGKLALRIYDDLLKIRQANQANKSNLSGRNLNPRGTGGFKGTD